MSPLPAPVERRGSRARRRLLAVDTGLGEAGCDNGVSGLELGREGRGGDEEEDSPVIDTTSVEVERKVDGKHFTWSKHAREPHRSDIGAATPISLRRGDACDIFISFRVLYCTLEVYPPLPTSKIVAVGEKQIERRCDSAVY